MAKLIVETTEGVLLPHEIAGAGSRGAAAVIDLIVWLAGLLFAISFLATLESVDPTGASGFAFGLLVGGGLLVLVLYHLILSVLWDGRTLGKALLGLRVRDLQGHSPRFVQLLLRSLFVPLEILPVPIPIGFAILSASERGQRLGDVVADTLVLRDLPASAEEEPFARQTYAGLPTHSLSLGPALAARFDDEDLELLRSIFATSDLEWGSRSAIAKRAAGHYAEVLGVPAPRSTNESAAVLKELYFYLRERRG